MFSANLPTRHYHVELLTEHYLLTGELEPFGPMMTYLNDAGRVALRLKNMEAKSLDASLALDMFRAEEMMVRKDEIDLIRPLDMVSQNTVPLMARREILRVFIGRFVVQASFPCGADTPISDIFDTSPAHWVPCLDAQAHIVQRSKQPVFSTAKLVLVNKAHIRFYQGVPAPAEVAPPPSSVAPENK
jgi:hypothetical protein